MKAGRDYSCVEYKLECTDIDTWRGHRLGQFAAPSFINANPRRSCIWFAGNDSAGNRPKSSSRTGFAQSYIDLTAPSEMK